jgi:hypothetical protein
MNIKLLNKLVIVSLVLFLGLTEINGQRWTEKQANDWFVMNGWLRGANFIPSSAINQLEMWQAETFDTITINRELGYAESIGFNVMRVFLNHRVWVGDAKGFKKRIGQYLAISDKHHIKTIFVFFDDCHYSESHLGKQPDPRPGIHNSGWVQDPGKKESTDTTYFPILEKYVKDIMNSFAKDKRIVLWDLYNEPGNSVRDNGDDPNFVVATPQKQVTTLRLLRRVYHWARETKATQPVTSCFFIDQAINDFTAKNTDIITFHDYSSANDIKIEIDKLRKYNRPIICTEYMARPESTFQKILPVLKEDKVGAINWGLVKGRTGTIYDWRDTSHIDGSEPNVWFHDIFRTDGSPFLQEEVDFIRKECFNSK